jgi:hypothetical protein
VIETLDTFVQFVKGQLVAANAQVTIDGVTGPQRVARVVQAADWPLTPPIPGALYLLVLGVNQLPQGTQSQNLFEYICQWTWLLIGQDIQAAQQAANRGDRYRMNLQIMANLRQAHFPGYCQKYSYAADQQTGALTATPVQSVSPYSNVESIWWTKPRFMPKSDNDKTGMLYGAASVSIVSFEDVAPVLAA